MASGSEIVDSDTNCTKHTDCSVYCNIPNAANEGSSTSKSHKSKFFHKILKYLMNSTLMQIIQSKKKNIRKRGVCTPCKSEERITMCTSLSSIVDDIIKSDAETVAKIKEERIDAITSTARSGKVIDKVTHENLSGVIEHFVRGASYRYARYTSKYVDNAMLERGCGPLCIGIGTQSNTTDGEFSFRTSSDVFAKACEERRHVDFILEEIAKVSDALTEKARLVFEKEQVASMLASVSVTSTRCEMREETFETTKPLISSIIHAEEKPNAAATAAVAVMQPETLTDTQVLSSSNHFAPDLRSCSECLDKSLDTLDIQVIPLIKYLKKTEHTRRISVMYPKRDDYQDAALITVVTKDKKEMEELPKTISPRRTLDKHVSIADKTNYTAVDSVIVNCIPKRKDSKSLDLYQPPDIQADASRQETVKNDTVESFIKTSQEEAKEESTRAKDTLQKSVPYKKPKYRAKYRINASYMTKEEKVLQFKETRVPKDPDKFPKYEYLFSPPSKTIKSSKSFSYLEKPAMEMYQDCQGKPQTYLQPIRRCKDLIPNNVYLGRPKYCDVWTTPCFSSQNETTRNATLTHAHCRPSQDSCAIKNHVSCHSLIDSHALSRYYNINDCAKRWVTFENLLFSNAYCKNDAKYCCPHLNNIDNVRMGYYHCNDNCPVWNNNQPCGRDRSYYWTKGNLYFTYPWTSEHLLRYN